MRVAKHAIVVLCCATLVSVCCAQTTSVTFQVVDTDGQSWNNGSWTAQLAMPSGQQPPQFVLCGTNTLVPNQLQAAGMNGTGNGSLQATPNSSICPGGSQWVFNFIPLATPAQSFQQSYTISGTSQVLFVIPPGVRVSVSTPVVRALAYLDLEVVGGNLGSTYFNLTDSSVHLCSTFSSNICTWTVGSGTGITIGGDLFAMSSTQQEVIGLVNKPLPSLSIGFLQYNGTNWVLTTPGGVISGLTTGFLPKATSSTTIGNSLYDDGITAANTGTYGGTGGFAAPNGPLSIGTPPTACGSAPNCIAFGQTATAGVPTAGQNYIKSTSTGFVCSINGGAETACIMVPVTGVTANGGLVMTGTTAGLLLTCTDKQVLAWVNGTSTWTCTTILSQGGGGLPASPQTGDSIRYNINGDTAWDLTQSASRMSVTMYWDGYGAGILGYGAISQFPPTAYTSGSASKNFANATDSLTNTLSSSASASISTGIGAQCCVGPNYGPYGFSFYRWSFRFKPGQTTNARYWMGLTVFDTGGLAGEQVGVTNTTSLATDTPNRHLLGFRYSSSTDTVWQCVASTGTAQTATTTGTALDITNMHTFEITYDGTTERCFYDGALVASVTTNLPAQSTPKAEMFWTGDNKNTANVVSSTSGWMTMEMR